MIFESFNSIKSLFGDLLYLFFSYINFTLRLPSINFSSEWSLVRAALISIGASAVAAGIAAVMNLNRDRE